MQLNITEKNKDLCIQSVTTIWNYFILLSYEGFFIRDQFVEVRSGINPDF
jgi:hypothetical protein